MTAALGLVLERESSYMCVFMYVCVCACMCAYVCACVCVLLCLQCCANRKGYGLKVKEDIYIIVLFITRHNSILVLVTSKLIITAYITKSCPM